LSEHPTQLVKHSPVGKDVAENILLGIAGIITNASKLPLSGKIILPPSAGVTEHPISLVYLLKPLRSLLFIAGIGIGVMFESKFPEGFLYIFLAGILGNAQGMVIILHIAFLANI
jgi:hypothetical protein